MAWRDDGLHSGDAAAAVDGRRDIQPPSAPPDWSAFSARRAVAAGSGEANCPLLQWPFWRHPQPSAT